jgi:mRNA interferase MazF
VTFEQFDVVVVPFPFTDRQSEKRRPAVVISLSGSIHSDRSVLAMVTSSRSEHWPLDVELRDFESAGLGVACSMRLKLFTLDHDLIVRKLGTLSDHDVRQAKKALEAAFVG